MVVIVKEGIFTIVVVTVLLFFVKSFSPLGVYIFVVTGLHCCHNSKSFVLLPSSVVDKVTEVGARFLGSRLVCPII